MWRRVMVIAVVLVLVACALPVAGLTAYLATRSDTPPATAQPSGSARASATPRVSRSPAKRPKAGDSQTVFQAWMRERVEVALDKQTQALLSGDAAGYVKPVDPAKTTLTAQLRKQFGSLRAMQVGAFGNDVLAMSIIDGKEFTAKWRVRVNSHPCFGAASCENDDFGTTMTWRLANPDTPLLSAVEADESANAPRPWQASDLIAKAGTRTVVATTKAYASVLDRVSGQAEEAAKVADRFAFRGKPPTRYVIFYAGPAEWKTWYGWDPPEWSAGVSIEVGDTSNIVLNSKDLQGWFLDNLLRHEMTHAASLPGGSYSRAWWLIEGIAEYAEMDGASVSRYGSIEETKAFVEGGSWNGHVAVSAPRDSDGDESVAAAYGVAFLAVRHLAEQYGEAKMIAFFDAVVHDGKTELTAANQVFGEDWTTVEQGCVDYIRSAV